MGGNPETLTNAAGVVVFEGTTSESGGSQAVSVIRFPFAFDTPGLASGVGFYTPTIGDVILDFALVIRTAWNGTTPGGDIGPINVENGGYYAASGQVPTGLGMNGNVWSDWFNSDGSTLVGYTGELPFWSDLASQGGAPAAGTPFILTSTKPIGVWVTTTGDPDGPSADPGATQGAADVILVIGHPTTVSALP